MKVYYILAMLCGASYGEFATKKEAMQEAKKRQCKYILRINAEKCPGTRGATIKYRVSSERTVK